MRTSNLKGAERIDAFDGSACSRCKIERKRCLRECPRLTGNTRELLQEELWAKCCGIDTSGAANALIYFQCTMATADRKTPCSGNVEVCLHKNKFAYVFLRGWCEISTAFLKSQVWLRDDTLMGTSETFLYCKTLLSKDNTLQLSLCV